MRTKKDYPFDPDVRRAIENDPRFAAAYFDELRTRPLTVQLTLLRLFMGWTQVRLAKELKVKQTHISRLEKAGSDHLLSIYQKAAEKLGARLALIPNSMSLVSRSSPQPSPR